MICYDRIILKDRASHTASILGIQRGTHGQRWWLRTHGGMPCTSRRSASSFYTLGDRSHARLTGNRLFFRLIRLPSHCSKRSDECPPESPLDVLLDLPELVRPLELGQVTPGFFHPDSSDIFRQFHPNLRCASEKGDHGVIPFSFAEKYRPSYRSPSSYRFFDHTTVQRWSIRCACGGGLTVAMCFRYLRLPVPGSSQPPVARHGLLYIMIYRERT